MCGIAATTGLGRRGAARADLQVDTSAVPAGRPPSRGSPARRWRRRHGQQPSRAARDERRPVHHRLNGELYNPRPARRPRDPRPRLRDRQRRRGRPRRLHRVGHRRPRPARRRVRARGLGPRHAAPDAGARPLRRAPPLRRPGVGGRAGSSRARSAASSTAACTSGGPTTAPSTATCASASTTTAGRPSSPASSASARARS